MYKLFYHKNGKVNLSEHQTKDEAYQKADFLREWELAFVDCITDENNVIVYDNFENVIGVNSDRKGQIYEAEEAGN